MKKLSIQNLTINVNNEKINIIVFEGKNEKYILYALVNNETIDSSLFEKMEFKEDIQVTPKKKFNDLKFSINSKDNLFSLLINNKPVYFLKNNKNINVSDKNLRLLLSNGSIYFNESQVNKRVLTIDKEEKNKNLINDILKKDAKIITFSNELPDVIVKKSEVVVENKEFKNMSEPVHNELKFGKLVKFESDDDESDDDESEEIVSKEVMSNEDVSKEDVSQESVSKEDVTEEIVSKETVSREDVTEEVVSKEDVSREDVTEEVVAHENVSHEPESQETGSQETRSHEVVSREVVSEELESQESIVITNKNNIHKNSEELEKKTNKSDNDVFNLENILKDFNKLFSLVDSKESTVHKEEQPKKNIINKEKKIVEEKPKLNEEIQQYYISKINYQNINYKINTLKLKASDELNFMNLYKSKVLKENIINKNNIALQLDEHNSSYLILFMNQKYLINKINNIVILTNLFNKTSQTFKNKDNFKIGLSDYMLYNSSLIIPMSNKKIFDNSYGTSYNVYLPRL
jgi:hypothetical protein